MQALQKSPYRSRLQIVWRNPFPVRQEKGAGVLLLLARDRRVASRSSMRRLIKLFGLSALFVALWHVRSLP